MILDQDQMRAIKELIDRSHRILIISHKAPDGDTLGSGLGLYQTFKNMGKEPDIFCVDLPADVFRFMPNVEKVQNGSPTLDYDAYFTVDVGATHLTGYNESHPQLFDKSMEVVNLDHHSSNDFFGRYNLVSIEAASATALITVMLEEMGIPIDRHAATCLLTGLYTDTGSFMHSNTNSEMMRIGARLVAKGANLRSISKDIFRTTKISTMHLWGRVMRNTYQTDDGVTMSVLTQKDFDDTGAEYSEITGVVDYVNSVPGSTYSVMLTERGGKVKGSLRTLRDEVNVADIAGLYGGGGHIKAAGFSLPGRLQQEVRWKVVEDPAL